jgi:ribosome-associated protein
MNKEINSWESTDDSEVEIVSKTQLKRIAEAKQELGKELSNLPVEKLKKFQLGNDLLDAITAYKTMNSNGAKKRQLQFIGKLMRSIETETIEAELNRLKQQSHLQTAHHHMLEKWRDRLLGEDGNQALTELLQQYSHLDVQHLRQLIRNAKKESASGKPPKSFRQIFRYLNDEISG